MKMKKTINVGSKKPIYISYDTDNIKDWCFICGNSLVRDIDSKEIYYEKYGNCCHTCNAKAQNVVKICSSIDRLKNKISHIEMGKLPKDMKGFSQDEIKAGLNLCQRDLKDAILELREIEPTHPYLE